MRVLIGCEFSGRVREAFRRHGHDAYSCDFRPASDRSPFHLQCDVREVLTADRWDLAILHPTCTYLCNSSVWALFKTPKNASPGVLYGQPRQSAMREAAQFFRFLLDAPVPRIAIENPVMHGYALAIVGRAHTQSIQPYEFGDDASKRTCLWLKNLPPLKPTTYVQPRIVNGKKRWSNQTDSGQNKLPPSNDRWALRSETYTGIAEAMATQWGSLDGAVEFSLTA